MSTAPRPGTRDQAAARFFYAVLFGLALALLVILALAWIAPRIAALAEAQPVQTSGRIECRVPVDEFEQMHIVAVNRAGRVVAECVYFGSRGTYKRGRK